LRIDEVLEFDHDPSDEEILSAIEKHSAYSRYTLQWLEPIKVREISSQFAYSIQRKNNTT
jgi:hypothetical protein